MFSGHKTLTFDSKFRVSIPSIFRESLMTEFQNKVVLTKHLNGPEINIWPNATYEKFVEKICGLPTDEDLEEFKHVFLAWAFHEEIDGNGRIFVAQPLREYALLGKEVVISGAGQYLLLASKDHWLEKDQKYSQDPRRLRSILTKNAIPY